MVSVGLAIFLAIASEIWKRLTAPKVPQKATDCFFQMAYANNAGIGRPKSNLRDVHNTSTTMPFHVLICADSIHYVGGFRSKQAMRSNERVLPPKLAAPRRKGKALRNRCDIWNLHQIASAHWKPRRALQVMPHAVTSARRIAGVLCEYFGIRTWSPLMP